MDSCCPVQVALRVRDLVPRERLEGFFSCINVNDSTTVVLGGERSFAFDYAFGPDTSQATVYDTSVRPLIESALSGINVSVLAYGTTVLRSLQLKLVLRICQDPTKHQASKQGESARNSSANWHVGSTRYKCKVVHSGQTGSGKTHTMGTDGLLGKSPDDYGVVPRIACDVFQACREMIGVSIVVSALEIYGEELRDLTSDDGKSRLQIREDRNGQITVVGLQEVAVSSTDELLEVLGKGLLKRATGTTNMNAASSRSHALCTITLQSSSPSLAAGSSPCKYPSMSQSTAVVYSKIQLVDLAGSERLTQTLSKTTKETCQINRGLHALSNVIMALSTPAPSAAAAPHVPYRDSKLTRVLQDSLGGCAKTLMIACVSAADESVQESLSTLQYATRARRIQNRICAPVSEQVPTPSDDSIVNLQWTLLRKYLSCVGLVPLPDILMQDLQGKDDEGTRIALLQAANKCFTTSPGKAARTFPRPATDFQHLNPGSAPGALPSSHTPISNSSCVHALSEPGCSPQFAPGEPALTSTVAFSMRKSKVDSSRASVCSADAASQTVTTEPSFPCRTPERRAGSAQTSTVSTPRGLRDSSAVPAHDIALKYMIQSQEGSAEGSRDPTSFGGGGTPNTLNDRHDSAAMKGCCPPTDTVLSGSGAKDFGRCCEGNSLASYLTAKDIVVFDEELASYISSTDYSNLPLDLCGQRDCMIEEQEDEALAAAETQNRLLETIRALEIEVMLQEGDLQAARAVEMRACIERDNAQNVCAQLHHQIAVQQHELEDLHKGVRELEVSLDRSEADKAAERVRYEERIQAANARKNSLEVQLRAQAAKASEGVAAASKISELSQNLKKLQASKASAERELQAEHNQREAKMQTRVVALQRQLRDTQRRAAVLQQDKARTSTVLQRKQQQLQDLKQTVQELQASLEASERRAAAAAVASTTPDKRSRPQRSQDGSCASGSRSITSDASTLEAAQRGGWWDEQISLLAHRVSAGKRTEHLQHRLSDIAQQISTAQQSASSESTAVLEDLKLQQHVLKSSLDVGRERVTSSTIIQRNLQHAAATLPAPALRKVLLHLVSSTLSAYTAACRSRAETQHLHTTLDRMSKLNGLLTVQVKSSIGISSQGSPTDSKTHSQAGDALMWTRGQSQIHDHGFPLSPKQTTDILQNDSSEQISPVALDSSRPLSKRASPRATANHPKDPQHQGALSADNLVHVDQPSPAMANPTPECRSSICVHATKNHSLDHGSTQGSREGNWKVLSGTAKQQGFQSISGSYNLKMVQKREGMSEIVGRMLLESDGAGRNSLPSPGKHMLAAASNMGMDCSYNGCKRECLDSTDGLQTLSSSSAGNVKK